VPLVGVVTTETDLEVVVLPAQLGLKTEDFTRRTGSTRKCHLCGDPCGGRLLRLH